MNADIGKLLERAKEAAERAYAPYSGFRVGAAVLDEGGRIFAGCNVENASYGLSLCAERSALAAAVAGASGRITVLALWFLDLPGAEDALPEGSDSPCGACRQWLAELAPEAVVVTNCSEDMTPVRDLLPKAFGLAKAKE